MSEFGKRLAGQLETRGLNQLEGARLLGLSQGALSRYLSGQTEPVLTTAAEIAARLGIKLSELTGEIPRSPGRTGVVRERPASYGSPPAGPAVLVDLKRRWKQAKNRRELELAIRVLFEGEAETVLDWLEEPLEGTQGT